MGIGIWYETFISDLVPLLFNNNSARILPLNYIREIRGTFRYGRDLQTAFVALLTC